MSIIWGPLNFIKLFYLHTLFNGKLAHNRELLLACYCCECVQTLVMQQQMCEYAY